MDEEEHQPLFRIIGFHRLVQIFKGEKLHFSHPSQWDDPCEMLVDHQAMDSVFIQCWTKSADSDAMWRIYSPNQLGVQVETSELLLNNQLSEALNGTLTNRKIHPVIYHDVKMVREKLEALKVLMNGEPTQALSGLFYKRDSFKHENEVRAAIYDKSGKKGTKEGGFQVSIDPHSLIRRILIDPRAPCEYVDAYKHYIKNILGFSGEVEKSNLYNPVARISFSQRA